MYTNYGYLRHVTADTGDGRLMLFASDTDYYEWLDAKREIETDGE